MRTPFERLVLLLCVLAGFVAVPAAAGAATGADLSTTIVPQATTVAAGDPITYTISVRNDGPTAADSVTLTDDLPAGTSAPSDCGGGWATTKTSTRVTATRASVPAGTTATCTLTVSTDSTLPDPTLLHDSASVSSLTPDPDSTNNSADATVGVGTLADLAVGIKAAPQRASPGDTITYTITLDNAGVDAHGVKVTNPLPAGTSLVSARQTAGAQPFAVAVPPPAARGDVTFSLSRFVAGGSATFEIVVSTSPALRGVSVEDTVTASTSTRETTTENNQATANTPVLADIAPPGTIVDLRTTATVRPRSVHRGDEVRIRLRVGDRGNRTATNTELAGTLPSGVRFVSAMSGGGECGLGPRLSCDLGTLLPRKAVTVTLIVRVTRPGRFTFKARARSDHRDRRPADNTAVVRLRVR